MDNYDSIMIGFGKGAKTLAVKLANKGEKIAVIEKSNKMYGGTCINVGCIPSKFMTVNSEKSSAYSNKMQYYNGVVSEKRKLIAALRAKNYSMLASNPNIEIIDGQAAFIDNHTLIINGENTVYGEKIFINTGSEPVIPSIKGIKDNKFVYTSETILDLDKLPENLVIVGGGYIGLEFASYFANYGAHVTVINNQSTFMPRDDRDIADSIFKTMSGKIDFLFGAVVEAIENNGIAAMIRIKIGEEEMQFVADAVLIATGRRAATTELNLKAAGVDARPDGSIIVDEFLRTSAPNIWAMGDVKGGLQFTYISLDDSRIVYSQLYGGKRSSLNRGAIPYSVFLDPAYSHVGLTEAEAKAKGFDVVTAKLDASAIPKAKVLNKTQGLLKVVVDRTNAYILGASLYCAESYELINQIKMAMDNNITFDILRDAVYTHPTMSEAFNDLFGTIII